MSDERLRELERRFRLSCSGEDEAAWRQERLRAGTLSLDLDECVLAHADMWTEIEEWALERTDVGRFRLWVVFADGAPTIREIKSVRRLDETYGSRPAHEVLAELKGRPEADLGEFGEARGRHMVEEAGKLGLKVRVEDRSFTYLRPLRRAHDYTVVLEDDDLADEVTRRMLAAGVPVLSEVHVH